MEAHSFNKNQENQNVIAKRLLWVSAFLLLGLIAALPVFWSRSDLAVGAKLKAESLAYQLAVVYQSSSRSPASAETQISADPWGRPYVYNVWVSPNGTRHLRVYSTGPDGRDDSAKSPSQILGDDVGVVIPLQ